MPEDAELTRLREIDLEYRTTLRVLAVVVEQLLAAGADTVVVISEGDLLNSPDLVAELDAATKQIQLSTMR